MISNSIRVKKKIYSNGLLKSYQVYLLKLVKVYPFLDVFLKSLISLLNFCANSTIPILLQIKRMQLIISLNNSLRMRANCYYALKEQLFKL